MIRGSATETLKERISQMEKLLGEWKGDKGIVSLWAYHTKEEILEQWNLLESHEKFVKDKVTGL